MNVEDKTIWIEFPEKELNSTMRVLRLQVGSQKELGEMIGLHQPEVSAYENGRHLDGAIMERLRRSMDDLGMTSAESANGSGRSTLRRRFPNPTHADPLASASRALRGITGEAQKDLAAKIGVDQATMSMFERSKRMLPPGAALKLEKRLEAQQIRIIRPKSTNVSAATSADGSDVLRVLGDLQAQIAALSDQLCEIRGQVKTAAHDGALAGATDALTGQGLVRP